MEADGVVTRLEGMWGDTPSNDGREEKASA